MSSGSSIGEYGHLGCASRGSVKLVHMTGNAGGTFREIRCSPFHLKVLDGQTAKLHHLRLLTILSL